jgi:elongation factor G
VFCAVGGVEPQSETVWRQADKHNVARLAFINKMDRVGASFTNAVGMIRERLGANARPVQLPLGEGEMFNGVIDLIRRKTYVYHEENFGFTFDELEVPADLKDDVEAARAELIEAVAEVDEGLLELYAEGTEPSEEQLVAAVRRATCKAHFVPVLCGSAFKNKGVQPLLDAVLAYLPAPCDVPGIQGVNPDTGEHEVREASDEQPLACLAFKIATDPYVGKLAYVRVYSGVLKAGTRVFNATKGSKQRIGQILRMHANKRDSMDEAASGEIVGVVGFKDITTGDTICDQDHPILLEQMNFPEPVIAVAVEPRTKADQDRLSDALHRLAEEDPTFRVYVDEDTGQTLIAGMGELHLEILVDRMVREFRVQANVGRPQVSYKETVTTGAEAEVRFARQTGGQGQYAHVILRVSPAKRGSTLVFESRVGGDRIPAEYVPAVEKGVREAMEGGVLAGYSLMDLKVELIGGGYHEVDSSDLSFKIAGAMALRDAARKAQPVLLEPVMDVEVVVPAEYMGDVTGDLNSRRGKIAGMHPRGDVQVVSANVPLQEMFGYATDLRSLTQGRAVYTMEFDHFEPVPKSVTERITQAVA